MSLGCEKKNSLRNLIHILFDINQEQIICTCVSLLQSFKNEMHLFKMLKAYYLQAPENPQYGQILIIIGKLISDIIYPRMYKSW